MTTAVLLPDAAAASEDADELVGAQRTLFVNISPIMESVAGRLTDAEIDDWFVGLDRANEGRGFYLELTAERELAINPMVNRDGGVAEGQVFGVLFNWAESNGGEAHTADTNIRLPDGSRVRADASWLSPDQVAELPPISAGGAVTVCPAFVVEIHSRSDRLSPLMDKMERYIANGARLGWLIDPYRRQVRIYRPAAEPELLEDPETLSGEPTLPGFEFDARRRIFDLHEPAELE